jgi:hypothetical protein
MIPHSSRAQMPGPTSVRTTVHGPALARVHHGSTSVSKGGSARRLRVPAKRSPCRGFATSCARPSPPFIRRGTTHNREVPGSNPGGAIAVSERNCGYASGPSTPADVYLAYTAGRFWASRRSHSPPLDRSGAGGLDLFLCADDRLALELTDHVGISAHGHLRRVTSARQARGSRPPP